MTDYALLIGPYFFGSIVIAFVLAIVSIWWSKSPLFKATAFLALGALVWLSFTAADNFYKLAFNNLSLPKPITFQELQDMLPEGHPGHLVLYGEAKNKSGIYLLLRSPGFSEPRYYLMPADEKLQEQFKDAQQKAKEKSTQLLIGGKRKDGKPGDKTNGETGGGKEKGERNGPGFDKSPKTIFHPAPVAGGPEKTSRPQDQPIVIPTPSPSFSPDNY